MSQISTTSATFSGFNQPKKVKIKGMIILDYVYFTPITSPDINTEYLYVAVSHVPPSLEPKRNEIETLLDTGLLARDFIAFRCLLNRKPKSFV